MAYGKTWGKTRIIWHDEAFADLRTRRSHRIQGIQIGYTGVLPNTNPSHYSPACQESRFFMLYYRNEGTRGLLGAEMQDFLLILYTTVRYIERLKPGGQPSLGGLHNSKADDNDKSCSMVKICK